MTHQNDCIGTRNTSSFSQLHRRQKCEATREQAKAKYLPTPLSSEMSGSSAHSFKNQPELMSSSEENGLLHAMKLLT